MKSTFKKLKKGKKSSSSSNSSSSSSTQQKNEKMFGGFITEQIHPFVLQSIEYMSEEDNVTQEGLFRVSGDVTHINRTKQMLNDDKEAMSRLTINEIAKNNVNNVAGLFKMYFREMAEPLLTFDHYDMFIAAHGVPDRETRIIVIKKVLRFLPRRNMQLLRTLCKFLHHVMQFASINKMTSSNLAIVFAPNLLRPKGDELVTMMSDSPHANGLMKTLIEEYELIFESGDDLEEEELRPAKGVGHRQQASHSSATGGSRSSNAHSSDDDDEDEDDSEEAEGDEEQDHDQAPMRQQQQQQRVLPSTPSRPLTIVPPSKESTDTVHYPSPYAVTSPTRPLPLPSTPTMTRHEISSPVMESKPVPPPRKSAMIKQNVGGVNSVLPPPRWPPSAASTSSASASSSSSSSSTSQFRLAPQSLPTSPVTVDKRVLPTPPPQSPRGSRASLPVPRASGAFLVEVDQKLSHFNNDNHHADPVTLRTVEANPTKPLPPPRKPARN